MNALHLRPILEWLRFHQHVERASSWPQAVEAMDSSATTSVEPITTTLTVVPPATVEPPANVLPGHFDHTALSVRDSRRFTKHATGTRNLDTVDLIVVHQMGVEFGVAASAVRRWVALLRDARPAVRLELVAFDMGDDEATARRLALHERFWDNVPYHVVSLLNGDIALNQRFDLRTFHGNAGNSGLGWAQEGRFPYVARQRTSKHTRLDDHVIETGQASFRLAVLKARKLGCPIRYVQPHRCYSTARTGDTGEEVWREIVLPLVDELELVVDYELKLGGRQVPRDWDAAALYDARGKRLPMAA